MSASDRMTTTVAAAILGASVTAASPAAAHDTTTTSIVSSDDNAASSDSAPTTDSKPAPANSDPAESTSLPGTEHIALLALAALSIGAAVVTVVIGKRRVLARSD